MLLTEYWDEVDRAARERKGARIFNGSVEHAGVIIERMFAHANNSLCFLSETLSPRAYGRSETLEQAKFFLSNPQHTLRILVETADDDLLKSNPLLQEFKNSKNMHLRRVSQSVRGLYKYHFAVMDGDCYRFESDKEKHAAIAVFGDQAGAANLQGIFNHLWTDDMSAEASPTLLA